MKIGLAQIETIIKTADAAADKGFAWMFVVLMGFGLAAVVFLFRYFTDRDDRLAAKLDTERTRFNDVLESTTIALTRNTEVMEQVLEFMRGSTVLRPPEVHIEHHTSKPLREH